MFEYAEQHRRRKKKSKFLQRINKTFYATKRHTFAHKTNKTHNSTQWLITVHHYRTLFLSTKPSCVKRIFCVNKKSKVYRFYMALIIYNKSNVT